MRNPDVSIIGGGFIGNILKRYYPDAPIYDKFKPLDQLQSVLEKKYIFIAFNLTDNGRETYEEIAAYPRQALSGRIFIIKSTFVPGTTDRLQAEFPKHSFVYNPEFLTELTAWEDFTKPQFQILGMPHQTLELWEDVFNLLPQAPLRRIISPRDAEVLKHAKNSYYALKVTWFNQLYDACKEINADYETVREILIKDPWIGDSHSLIFHRGYRGYGGKCLPKDTKNFATLVNFPLSNQIEAYNANLHIAEKM